MTMKYNTRKHIFSHMQSVLNTVSKRNHRRFLLYVIDIKGCKYGRLKCAFIRPHYTLNCAFKREFLHRKAAYIDIMDALFERTAAVGFLKFSKVILRKILPPQCDNVRLSWSYFICWYWRLDQLADYRIFSHVL